MQTSTLILRLSGLDKVDSRHDADEFYSEKNDKQERETMGVRFNMDRKVACFFMGFSPVSDITMSARLQCRPFNNDHVRRQSILASYGCESWTLKKADQTTIYAFEMWCYRRVFNQGILDR